MGTIAARDAIRVLTLTEQCIAALLFATTQALWLRERQGELVIAKLSDTLQSTLAAMARDFALIEEDRPLENELRALLSRLQTGQVQELLT